jgi:hypothetical protein
MSLYECSLFLVSALIQLYGFIAIPYTKFHLIEQQVLRYFKARLKVGNVFLLCLCKQKKKRNLPSIA